MKRTNILLIAMMLVGFAVQAQYYPFGSNFNCVCNEGDSLAYVNAKAKLKSTMQAYQDKGELYGYDVDFHNHNNEEGDSTHFSVMVFAQSEADFESSMRAWEKTNPEVLELLNKKCPERTDEQLWDQGVSLPVIKDMSAMVMDAKDLDYTPSPSMQYNIVIDFTIFVKEDPEEDHSHSIDPSSVNWGLGDIGRQLNLHVGAGIPHENVNIVAAVHGMSSESFLTNEAYQKRHEIDNPNIPLIDQLTDAGIDFMICYQSLGDIKKENLLPNVKLTFSAQTTLSEFQMKGYALKVMKNE